MDNLQTRLTSVGYAERDKLLMLKKEECTKNGLPFDGEFYVWDSSYYQLLNQKRSMDFDVALLKEYFPVDVIVPTTLEIYQDLLGVKFRNLAGDG